MPMWTPCAYCGATERCEACKAASEVAREVERLRRVEEAAHDYLCSPTQGNADHLDLLLDAALANPAAEAGE